MKKTEVEVRKNHPANSIILKRYINLFKISPNIIRKVKLSISTLLFKHTFYNLQNAHSANFPFCLSNIASPACKSRIVWQFFLKSSEKKRKATLIHKTKPKHPKFVGFFF